MIFTTIERELESAFNPYRQLELSGILSLFFYIEDYSPSLRLCLDWVGGGGGGGGGG